MPPAAAPALRAARSRKRKGRRWIVSETVSRGREAGQQAEVLAAAEARGSRGRRRWAALGIVAVVAAGAVSAWRGRGFFPAALSRAGPQGGPPPATQAGAPHGLPRPTPPA